MEKFIIVNSCGTRCFTDKRFDSFEDGWDFIYSEFPVQEGDDREEILNEFSVIREDMPHIEYMGGLYVSWN
jgi:hypothetical protein